MEMSRAERAILHNQLLIMDMLAGPTADATEKKERAKAREALAGGFEGAYDDVFAHFSEETLSERDCKDVSDILWMFEVIERRWNESQDKLGVEEWQAKFKGWDSSNEPRQYRYAQYLVRRGNPWSTLAHRAAAGDGAISPLPRYLVMLRAWQGMGSPYQELTMKQVKTIADAWTAYRDSH